MDGQLSQHVEYIPFGEVLFEEHSSSFSMPYLFNGKELDRETNLSYYGARYLDMKTSLWLNVDPLAEKFPHASPYNYCLGNPIRLTDPTGMEPVDERNNDERKIDITVPISSGYESNLQKLLNINKTGTTGINPDGDSDDSGLNHAMHLGDDNGYDKNGKQVNNKGGDTTDYLYDEKGNIIDSTPVQFRAVSQEEFRELGGFRGYGVKGFPMATGAINDDSLNFTTNLVGAGEIYHGGKLIAMGFTKVLKSSVGVRTVLGGSKYTLKSSVYFEKMIGSKSINVLGVKSLPTLYGRSTTWGTFLGRNAPIIGTGRIGFGGYLISN